MEKHSLQWFKDRVGKRVYRTEGTCPCEVCKKVAEVGLVKTTNFTRRIYTIAKTIWTYITTTIKRTHHV